MLEGSQNQINIEDNICRDFNPQGSRGSKFSPVGILGVKHLEIYRSMMLVSCLFLW